MSKCYLVAYVRKTDATIESVGLFSEASPTLNYGKYFPVVITETQGKDYQDALDTMKGFLSTHGPMWLGDKVTALALERA